MIDWYNLAANSLWIFALALALATVSFARWEAHSQDIKIGKLLSQPRWQIKLNIGGGIFSIGLAATSTITWEQALWLVMAAFFVVQVGLAAKSKKEG